MYFSKERIIVSLSLLLFCSIAVSCDKDDDGVNIIDYSCVDSNTESAGHSYDKTICVEHIYGEGKTYCAFTSLIKWNGSYYLAFREGSSHVSSGDFGKIVILKSVDGEKWDVSQRISVDGVDLRDPNLSIMPDGRLYLLCGARKKKQDNTYITKTIYSIGDNGFFESMNDIKTQFDNNSSFWIWRIEWKDNIGYGTAYTKGEDDVYHAFLVSTIDGIHFDFVSEMNVGYSPTECRVRFLADGTMVALMRNDYNKSQGGYIGISFPPYTNWEWKVTNVPFAGQDFILIKDNIFVVTRTKQNGEEKTGLFILDLNGSLQWQYMLPSYGKSSDTAYGSICSTDEEYWISYYSMHETTKPSIYLAKIPYGVLSSH